MELRYPVEYRKALEDLKFRKSWPTLRKGLSGDRADQVLVALNAYVAASIAHDAYEAAYFVEYDAIGEIKKAMVKPSTEPKAVPRSWSWVPVLCGKTNTVCEASAIEVHKKRIAKIIHEGRAVLRDYRVTRYDLVALLVGEEELEDCGFERPDNFSDLDYDGYNHDGDYPGEDEDESEGEDEGEDEGDDEGDDEV